MRWSFWMGWILMLTGAILLQWPMEENSFVSYQESFTLPLQSLSGIALLVLSGTWMIIKIIQRRKEVLKRLSRQGVLLAILGMLIGILVSLEGKVNADNRLAWTGIILTVLAFFTLTYSSFQKTIE